MIHIEDKSLSLPHGRTLAYAENGNTTSSTIVLFFHGMFGVGDASSVPPAVLEKGYHYLTPTLPGWGASSPPLASKSYAEGLAADITALITHLRPNLLSDFKLYIGGGSFGTVAAQMLLGAPYDTFPLGRYIAGVVLFAPLAPLNKTTSADTTHHTKAMTWATYMFLGPPSRYLPFHVLPRTAKLLIGRKLRTLDGARTFLDDTIFNKMGSDELRAFEQWRMDHGKEKGQKESELARDIVASVRTQWGGFHSFSDVVRSNWGFRIEDLDGEHAAVPVLVVAAGGDEMAPIEMAQYLVGKYKNARLKMIDGGHLAALYHFDSVWEEVLRMQ